MESCLAACQVRNRDGLVVLAIHVGRRPSRALRVVVASVRLSLEENLGSRTLHVVVEAWVPAMLGRAPANHQPDLVDLHNLDAAASSGPQTTAVQEEDCSLLPWTFYHVCHCFARICHPKSVRVAF